MPALVVMAITLFTPFQVSCTTAQKAAVAVSENVVPKDSIDEELSEMPSYPGGLSALLTRIARNLRYPREAQEAYIQGRVMVSFVVERDGSVTNVRVQKPVNPHLDREAVRVVKTIEKWTPGKNKKGEAARVRLSVPVSFRILSQPPADFPHQRLHRPFNRP
jgi:protein TonB